MRAYRAIFAHPGTRAMTAAAFVGRFPMAMIGLAVTLLVVGETDSYGLAGGVASALMLAGAVGGPVGARWADRYGQHRVLPPLLVVSIVALAGLTGAVVAGWPRPSWFVLAAVVGFTSPNLGAMVRARWGHTVSGKELISAFALESTLDEVAFVVGPPLATALAVGIAPWVALLTAMLLGLVGGLVLAAQRATEPSPVPRSRGSSDKLWRYRLLVILMLLMPLTGSIFGALDVSVVAFAEEHDVLGWTGLILGCFALASMLTGIFLGARPGMWPLPRQIAAGSFTLALTTALLPWIDAVWLFAAGMFAAGLGVSAVLIGAFQLVERQLPRQRLTESLALLIAGLNIGTAASVALAGALIDVGGSRAGILVAATGALAGLLVVLAGLRPSAGRPGVMIPAG
ncbi:MAG: MFS transporter [Candidatus Nanopelagicales bacterium]